MSIEAMKLALEALDSDNPDIQLRAAIALRQAIAEAEKQEPVANGIIRTLVSIDKDGIETWKHEPFYTTSPQREWVGLTEEDKNNCLVSADPCECLAKPESHQLIEDVEAKLREKNT